jgi:septal ring factor EnvC (AmiA/AmiB activator)
MSLLGSILEAVTAGAVREKHEEDVPPVLTQAPVQAHPTLSVSAAPAPVMAQESDIEKLAATNANTDLNTVLAATPEKFQDFLMKKREFVELLTEAGSAGEKIESLATSRALKATKLSIADINAAKAATVEALNGIKRQMAGEIEDHRNAEIVQPSQAIAATQGQIKRLREQVTEIQRQIQEFESGIGPKQQAIAAADGKLTHAQKVFELSCTMVLANLDTIEAAIMAAMRKQ